MDRLSTLEVFVAVAERGSFSKAADDLNLSNSAVSKQVAALEERLGARLLNRTTRRVSLTDVGQAYWERAKAVLADLEEADAAAASLHDEARGVLKMSVPFSFSLSHLPPVIADFMAAHPKLEIDLVLNDRFVDIVDEGFDVAIRIGELADSSLKARRIAPVRRVLAASPAFLDRVGRPDAPDDLNGDWCLRYSIGSDTLDLERESSPGDIAAQIKTSGPLRVNNGDMIREAMLRGIGIASLPTFIIGEDLKSGALERVLPDWCASTIAMYAVYPPGKALSAKVRLLIDFLAERFGPVPPWDAFEDG
ncbi:MAG: LysR family transcriptional regulator [Candidatus Phaeomarinobacter sp.]